MADNTKIGPIFRGANGGLSDDLFTGIRNSFYYSNNMEVREDAKSIYPKQNPRYVGIDLGQSSSVGALKAILYFNNSRYAFTENNVYKLDFGNEQATPLASWFGGLDDEPIVDAEIFNGYVYIATTDNLYCISQTAADADWASSSNFDGMELNKSSYHPLYATDIMMVVGNKTEVGKVTKEIPDQIQSGIELQADYFVKFINELGGFIRITATDGYYGNDLLLWDKVSDAANEIIPMNGYTFMQSCIYNGYHYLLSDKGLGLMNGYQYYILKKSEDLEPDDVIKNGMIVYDDKLFFSTTNGLYIYGAKNKNYNDVLSLWSARTDIYGKPGPIDTNGQDMIFTETSRSDDDNRRHQYVYLYVDGGEKGTQGEFQTMAYFGSSMSEIKQSAYLRVGYALGSGGYIKIYYRTEADATDDNVDGWAWHELTQHGGLTINSDTRSPFATTLKLNCRFQWIQFKFELYQSKNTARHTTNLYSADLYYNDMLD